MVGQKQPSYRVGRGHRGNGICRARPPLEPTSPTDSGPPRTLQFGLTIEPKINSKVAEALRLLRIVAERASQDPKLIKIAARTSLLAHEIENHHTNRGHHGS